MIGDGMGLSQVSSAFYFQESPSNFERFEHIGIIQTSSATHKITDSAAGATAFSTGVRTYNEAVAVSKDTTVLETIFERYAETKSSGLVVTSSVTHATPASFYAHVNSRYAYEGIATYLHKSPIDFAIGGGVKFFSSRTDENNYLDSLADSGFIVDTTSLKNFDQLDNNEKYAFLLAEDGMPRASLRGDYLPQSTQLALDFLSCKKEGFLLLVEGSQIDWGGHDNDAEHLIEEVIDFDRTIGTVLDFADKNQETLVVVMADHETGGFTLAAENGMSEIRNYSKIVPSFSTIGHSASLIPVFAYGPGAETLSGVYQNKDIYHKIVELLESRQ